MFFISSGVLFHPPHLTFFPSPAKLQFFYEIIMALASLRLKKGEDRRIRAGHPWVFSNEIATTLTPLKSFKPGQEVWLETQDGTYLGNAYVNPHSLIAARVYSHDKNDRLDQSFFIKKLQAALRLREQLYPKPYYRLVFSEGDSLPGLIIDRFANDLVIQLNTAGMDAQQQSLLNALREVFPSLNSVLLRNDSPIRQHEGLPTEVKALYGEPPAQLQLEENGVKFIAPLWEGQKTGWFYDHRDNRAKLQKYVQGKKVLDVFSYLGGFGIQAAVFGATRVDCVDASPTACALIQQNAALNHVSAKVHTIHEDAFVALKNLLQSGQQYDCIVLDPPAFVKKNKDRQEGMIAYQRINELSLKLLAPQGILITCSCSMHIRMEELIEITQRAAAKTKQPLQMLERGHQGMDHPIHPAIPETDYLKALVMRKLTD